MLTYLLWEDTLYEKGGEIADRMAKLVKANKAEDVLALAIKARTQMQLPHTPLWLLRALDRWSLADWSR